MRHVWFARSLASVWLALPTSGLTGCQPGYASHPAAVRIPDPDSALIEGASPDLLRLRVNEPGYVLVFAVGELGSWYLTHPAPWNPAAYAAAPTTVPLWRPTGSTSVPSSIEWRRPSDQMCTAEPQLCSTTTAQTLSSPTAAASEADHHLEFLYVVVITGEKPDPDQLLRRLHREEPPRRANLVPRWLAEQVARQLPVHRWSAF